MQPPPNVILLSLPVIGFMPGLPASVFRFKKSGVIDEKGYVKIVQKMPNSFIAIFIFYSTLFKHSFFENEVQCF